MTDAPTQTPGRTTLGQTAGQTATRFCTGCGAALSENARFCTACGRSSDPGAAAIASFSACRTCGGDGARLAPDQAFCPKCRWLRPLGPGYDLPVAVYMYSLDAQAMAALQAIAPLRAAARALSERVGRPWLEAAVNGIRLGPDQLPHIFERAVLAARVVGLRQMPEIYISGEQMWDAMTLGGGDSAFVVLGSVLNNFKDRELLYVLGREMGHARAGHAQWRTVLQFMTGMRTYNKSLFSEGMLKFLNPLKLVESAVDAPLMAWARHAEITADRAGALVVGDESVVRKVATQWALRSFPLYRFVNLDALERQIAESDDKAVAEMTMTSTPYLARRLKLMRAFIASDEARGWRRVIDHWLAQRPASPPDDLVRLRCVACQTPLRFPRTSFGAGGAAIKVRCPNPACATVMEVKPAPPSRAIAARIAAETVRLTCAACGKPLRAPRHALAGQDQVLVRCPSCRTVLAVTRGPPEYDDEDDP